MAKKSSTKTLEFPSAFDLFRPSWEAFKLNWSAFVLGAAVPLVLLIFPAIVLSANAITSTPWGPISVDLSAGSLFFNIIAIIVGVIGLVALLIFFGPYMVRLKLRSAKGQKTSFKENFNKCLPLFWRVVGLLICRNLIIGIGFLLFIVPGFFMWRRYMLSPFYLVDQNLGIREALDKSAKDSVPFSSYLWGMIGVYVIINAAGIVPYLGTVVSAGMGIAYVCAQSTRYLQIKKATKA